MRCSKPTREWTARMVTRHGIRAMMRSTFHREGWRRRGEGGWRGLVDLTTGDRAEAALGLAIDVKEPCPHAAVSAVTAGRGELNGFGA